MLQTYIIIAAVSFVIGSGAGWTVHDWKTDAALAKAMEQAEAEHLEFMHEAAELIGDESEKQQKIKIVYRTIREKTHEINNAECLNTDGVGLWNNPILEANANTKADKSDGAVRAAAAAIRGKFTGDNAKPH